MSVALAIAGIVVALWALAEVKTSRPDGTLLRVHPYRRLLAFISPGRAQSSVTFDAWVDADPLLAYVEDSDADVTHAVVAACLSALAEVPRMNRFVVGRRLYQRRGEWATFSMKRKKLDREAKVAMVKLKLEPGETFGRLRERIDGLIGEQRGEQATHEDREYGLFDRLPRPLLAVVVATARWLDAHNLLPGWFIEGDGLFTSVVVANLGSLGMGAAYHHLYEWGTCPLFLVVGAVEERAVVVDDQVVARRQLPLRFTYDERIDDGLNARFGIDAVVRILSDPAAELADGLALDRRRPG